MKRNNPLKPLLIFVFLFTFLVFASLSYISYLKSPVDPKAGIKAFVIQKGESISFVAERLEKEEIIKSAFIFRLQLKITDNAESIDAGDFKLSPAMNLDQVIKVLRSGPVDKWVTLIEGLRVEEIAKELNEKLKIQSEKFIQVAKKHEGYLFPDTYLFNPDATEEDIVSILRANFEKKYTEELQTKIKKLGLTPHQGVILASIVEREARTEGVRTIVASILLKRLKIGMGLQADATIQYALGYQTEENPPIGGWWKRHLSKDDLKINSPYSTYLYAGLPPGPICNPSLMSLKAVAHADPETPYLYYYHDSKGNSYYATNLEEHNKNVANNP